MLNRLKEFNLKKIQKKYLWLGILGFSGILLIAMILGYFKYFLNTPASKDASEVDFTIENGEGVRAIASRLEEKKIVKNDFPLLVYLKVRGLSADIKAGVYRLSTSNTPEEVVDILTNGKVASKKITIPEGWNTREIGNYLEKQGIVSSSDFISATKLKYNYSFLSDLPEGASVEGFLFPDTYQLPYSVKAEDIVKRMLDNFNSKLTDERKADIAASNLSTYKVVTLASIVEKEVSKPEDRKLVAGVFLKRLEEGMKLQSDVTVNYALKNDKNVLDYTDISVDSPYNTYKVSGLPFGPISNPSLEAIDAVLHPEFTEFRYFLAAKDGQTYYSKTLEEHEAKKAKYLQ